MRAAAWLLRPCFWEFFKWKSSSQPSAAMRGGVRSALLRSTISSRQLPIDLISQRIRKRNNNCLKCCCSRWRYCYHHRRYKTCKGNQQPLPGELCNQVTDKRQNHYCLMRSLLFTFRKAVMSSWHSDRFSVLHRNIIVDPTKHLTSSSFRRHAPNLMPVRIIQIICDKITEMFAEQPCSQWWWESEVQWLVSQETSLRAGICTERCVKTS
jgi:hypothetical protein